MRIPVDAIKVLAMDIKKAVEMGLTDAGYEWALLYAVTVAISREEKDPHEAIAKQLYIIKNNPTEKVAFDVAKEGAE